MLAKERNARFTAANGLLSLKMVFELTDAEIDSEIKTILGITSDSFNPSTDQADARIAMQWLEDRGYFVVISQYPDTVLEDEIQQAIQIYRKERYPFDVLVEYYTLDPQPRAISIAFIKFCRAAALLQKFTESESQR